MSTRRGLLTLSTVCVVFWTTVGASADEFGGFVEIPGDREFSGQMIARPVQPDTWADRGVKPEQATLNAQAAGASMAAFNVVEFVWQTDEYIFEVPAGSSENQVANQLMATGNFQYVEPDWTLFPIGCPNDPRLGNQWHHNANRLQSCDGWDLYTGDPSTVVGICDTGVRTIPPTLKSIMMFALPANGIPELK